jgi:hypothetical protein
MGTDPKNLKAMKNQNIISFESKVYNYFMFIGSLYSFGDEDEINNLSHNNVKWEAK